MLQQMLNLVNMLILADDLELTRLVLNQYDAILVVILGHEKADTWNISTYLLLSLRVFSFI